MIMGASNSENHACYPFYYCIARAVISVNPTMDACIAILAFGKLLTMLYTAK